MAKKTAVPSLESVSIDYKEKVAKGFELNVTEEKLKAEIEKILSSRRSRAKPRLAAERDGRVATLLGDETDASERPEDLEKYSSLVQQLSDVCRAKEINADRVHTARMAASRTICEQLRPDYAKSVGAVADALVTLHNAIESHHAFKAEFDRQDVSLAYLPSMTLPSAFTFRIGAWLREAVEAGLYRKANVPTELQQ